MKKIISVVLLVLLSVVIVQRYGNTEERKFNSYQEKVYAARKDRSFLKTNDFEDLCLLGQLSSSDSGLKQDLNDSSYIDDAQKAKNYFEKALKIHTDSPHPYRGLALLYYYDFNDVEKFIEYADKAMALEYNNFDLPFVYAEIYSKQGDQAKAREYYTKAKYIMDTMIANGDQTLKDSPPYKEVTEILSSK